jgi:hypothetical protein
MTEQGLGAAANTSGQDAAVQQAMASQARDQGLQQAAQQQAGDQALRQGGEQVAFNGVDPALTPPPEGGWIAHNQGKALLGLGAAAMGTDAYYRDKAEDEAKDRRKKDKKDWRGRVDWYNSQSGPTNEMTDYENR